MHICTKSIIFHFIWDYFVVIFPMIQKQQKNMVEPSLDQTEEVEAVEAFKTCHTTSNVAWVTRQEKHL
jgi:hypothetical protein